GRAAEPSDQAETCPEGKEHRHEVGHREVAVEQLRQLVEHLASAPARRPIHRRHAGVAGGPVHDLARAANADLAPAADRAADGAADLAGDHAHAGWFAELALL